MRSRLCRSPRAISAANSAARAKRAQKLRIAIRRDDRRAARQLRERAIPELHRESSPLSTRYGFLLAPPALASAASSAARRFASAPSEHLAAETMNVGVEFAPTLPARSRSASISGSVRCLLTHWRYACHVHASRCRRANRTAARGSWHVSHFACVANRPSCIGQNLFCTAAHIAASAAGIAYWMHAQREVQEGEPDLRPCLT